MRSDIRGDSIGEEFLFGQDSGDFYQANDLDIGEKQEI